MAPPSQQAGPGRRRLSNGTMLALDDVFSHSQSSEHATHAPRFGHEWLSLGDRWVTEVVLLAAARARKKEHHASPSRMTSKMLASAGAPTEEELQAMLENLDVTIDASHRPLLFGVHPPNLQIIETTAHRTGPPQGVIKTGCAPSAVAVL